MKLRTKIAGAALGLALIAPIATPSPALAADSISGIREGCTNPNNVGVIFSYRGHVSAWVWSDPDQKWYSQKFFYDPPPGWPDTINGEYDSPVGGAVVPWKVGLNHLSGPYAGVFQPAYGICN